MRQNFNVPFLPLFLGLFLWNPIEIARATNPSRLSFDIVSTIDNALVVPGVMNAPLNTAIREKDLFEINYPERQDIILATAKIHPGAIKANGHKLKHFGTWGSTEITTEWQFTSKRAQDPKWRYLNTLLTIVPALYLIESIYTPGLPCYLSPYALTNATPVEEEAPATQNDVCEAWSDFFKIKEKGRPKTIQKYYWKAHMKTLIYGIWRYQDEIIKHRSTDLELDFWFGYLKYVELYSELNGPTQDTYAPLLIKVLPKCYPLGAPGCRYEELPAFSREWVLFMVHLAKGPNWKTGTALEKLASSVRIKAMPRSYNSNNTPKDIFVNWVLKRLNKLYPFDPSVSSRNSER